MLDIIIIFLIFVGLITHRYLTEFWEQGILPYSMGFLTFANFFTVIYLINFIWMFGILVGIGVFLLTIFQIIYGSYLWPFLLPLINIHKKPTITKVNPFIYGAWLYVVIGVGLLTVLNFFVSDYGSLLNNIKELFDNNYATLAFWLIGTMIAGNLIRSYVLSRYMKQDREEPLSREKEIEEAIEILDEASHTFDTRGFELVKERIEEMLLAHPDEFVDVVKKGTSTRQWIYSAIANTAGNMVESGHYHVWRGVLDPIGPGEDLLKLFDGAIDELVKIGALEMKNAKTQKRVVRKNIKNVG